VIAARACLTLLAVLYLSGCTSLLMVSGDAPRTDALAGFVSGKTTAAEVRAALGLPRGVGLMRHREDLKHRKIWFYEQMQTRIDPVPGRQDFPMELHVLLVYFDEDGKVYDGYWWFRGRSLLKDAKS